MIAKGDVLHSAVPSHLSSSRYQLKVKLVGRIHGGVCAVEALVGEEGGWGGDDSGVAAHTAAGDAYRVWLRVGAVPKVAWLRELIVKVYSFILCPFTSWSTFCKLRSRHSSQMALSSHCGLSECASTLYFKPLLDNLNTSSCCWKCHASWFCLVVFGCCWNGRVWSIMQWNWRDACQTERTCKTIWDSLFGLLVLDNSDVRRLVVTLHSRKKQSWTWRAVKSSCRVHLYVQTLS